MNRKKNLLLNWWAAGGGNTVPQTLIDKINSYQTVDLGVFVLSHSATSPTQLFRVFIPFNERFAEFYTLRKEVSPDCEYWNQELGQGISEYFEIKMPDSNTGTWTSYGTSASSYTQTVGGTMTLAFNGTGLKFRTTTDNRGGLWRFVIDGGSPVDVSVYSDAALTQRTFTIADFGTLVKGNHTVVATFMGDDPDHVPSGGAGTSRGWACTYNLTGNISIYNKAFWVLGSSTPNYCKGSSSASAVIANDGIVYYDFSTASHRECALNTRLNGSSTSLDTAWWPLHTTIGNNTIFDDTTNDRTLKLDSGDNLISTLSGYQLGFGGDQLQLYQKCKGYNKNGSDTDILYEYIEQLWTFDKNGLQMDIKVTVKSQLDSSNTSYISMIDALKTNFDWFVFDDGTEVEVDGANVGNTEVFSKSQLQSGVWGGSLFSCNKTGNDLVKSLVQAYQLVTPVSNALLLDKDYDQYLSYLRDTDRVKIYPQVVRNKVVNAGEVYQWSVKWRMAVVPDAYNVLKPA